MVRPAICDDSCSSPAAYNDMVERMLGSANSDGIVAVPVTQAGLRHFMARVPSNLEFHAILPEGRALALDELAAVAMEVGCRPEYMNILGGIFEILLSGSFPVELLTRSEGSFFAYVVVNGPIRHLLEINCRPNVFGPGFQANATIGRAVQLGLIRFLKADPRRSTLGNAYKFTCVIGEDEEQSPWPALHTRFGRGGTESSVTVLAGMHTKVVSHQLTRDPEQLLRTFAEEASTSSQFNPVDVDLRGRGRRQKVVIVMADDHRAFFKDAGWDEARIRKSVHQLCKRKAGDVRACGYRSDPRLGGVADGDECLIFASPEDIILISAGSGGGRTMVGTAIDVDNRVVASLSRVPPLPRSEKPETYQDYAALVARMIADGSTDGWPVKLPTATEVEEMIRESGLAADDVLGETPWRQVPIVVRDLAVNAFMAGCRAKDLPLVAAMYRLLFIPKSPRATSGASTMGYNPWWIVHGPVGPALGINSGGGLFGPGERANVVIGRALRLGMMNLAGQKPNLVDRSCLGQAFKYGSVFSEDDTSLGTWDPWRVSLGLGRNSNGVTMAWGGHPRLCLNSEARAPEELLRSIAEEMSTITMLDAGAARGPEGGTTGTTENDPGAMMRDRGRIAVLGGRHRRLLQETGWAKGEIEDFLYRRCFRSAGDARASGYGMGPFVRKEQADEDRIQLAPRNHFHIVCAGGDGDGSMILPCSPTMLSIAGASLDPRAWKVVAFVREPAPGLA